MTASSTHESFSLAIDLGGTKMLIAVLAADGRICDESEHPTRPSSGERIDATDMERVVRFAELAAVRHREITATSTGQPVELGVVALGVPEYVTADGVVSSTEVLSGMRGAAARFQDRWAANDWGGVRTVIESDVRLGALGEYSNGAGAGLTSLAYLSIGTGLSSACVLDGAIWAGHRGEAIALGEWPVANRTADEASASMNLEQYSSGAGIARRYAAATGEHIPTRVITDRAAAGDSAARDILVSAGTAVGRAASMLVDVLDPEGIVLGGGLGTAPGLYRDALEAEYAVATSRRPYPPRLMTARNGARAGLIGAIALARALRREPG